MLIATSKDDLPVAFSFSGVLPVKMQVKRESKFFVYEGRLRDLLKFNKSNKDMLPEPA